MGEILRVFVAVDFPDGDAKRRVIEVQEALSETGADIKPVEPENLHVTLRFLGEIEKSLVERVKMELSTISFQPFNILFEGVGAFPDLRRINVVWIGIASGNVELLDLYGKINQALARCGLPPERRGFSPHLTVARVRSGRNMERLSKRIMELRGLEIGGFMVDSFRLKRSTLTPRGPIYNTLLEVPALK
ncbi:RNA 2',3'-cyclic phosphodiesterase [Candidatus Bathyarchaeota archaeon]|nr:RNA 2',3'-cyclic phosphodiesterase [Candidatus Bathyarchaeota archaeon]